MPGPESSRERGGQSRRGKRKKFDPPRHASPSASWDRTSTLVCFSGPSLWAARAIAPRVRARTEPSPFNASSLFSYPVSFSLCHFGKCRCLLQPPLFHLHRDRSSIFRRRVPGRRVPLFRWRATPRQKPALRFSFARLSVRARVSSYFSFPFSARLSDWIVNWILTPDGDEIYETESYRLIGDERTRGEARCAKRTVGKSTCSRGCYIYIRIYKFCWLLVGAICELARNHRADNLVTVANGRWNV